MVDSLVVWLLFLLVWNQYSNISPCALERKICRRTTHVWIWFCVSIFSVCVCMFNYNGMTSNRNKNFRSLFPIFLHNSFLVLPFRGAVVFSASYHLFITIIIIMHNKQSWNGKIHTVTFAHICWIWNGKFISLRTESRILFFLHAYEWDVGHLIIHTFIEFEKFCHTFSAKKRKRRIVVLMGWTRTLSLHCDLWSFDPVSCLM